MRHLEPGTLLVGRTLALLGVLAVSSPLSAQVHPAAARTWNTDEPVDALISTPNGAWIDQTQVIEPTGAPTSIATPIGSTRPPIDVDPRTPAIAIQVDWSVLEALNPAHWCYVGLPLPEGGAPLELVLQWRQERTPTQYSWFGQIAGVANSEVLLVRHDDALRVVVRNSNPYGRTFEVRGAGQQHVLYESRSLLGECEGALQAPDVIAPAVPDRRNTEQEGAFMGGPPSDPADVVDILVVASDEARSAYGGPSQFLADAHAMIADSNLRVNLSGGPWTFRLVGADWNLIVGYSQRAELNQDLWELTWPIGHTYNGYTNVDAVTDQIQALRHYYRPDLVALITTNGTGSGWRVGATEGLTAAWGYFAANRSVAVSNGTFAHEAGHNLGACHNANASQPACAQTMNGTDRGIERYCDVPDGICGGCEDTEFRTTMAYRVNQNVNAVRVQRYSVEGLTATLYGSFGNCTVDLWDTDARVMLTFEVSRPYVSNYNVARAQIWAVEGGSGAQTGTWQEPVASIRTASQLVLGGPDYGVVRARAGVYQETSGAPIVISTGCQIVPEGGVIRLQ